MAFDYVSNTTLDQIARILRADQRIVVTTHAKPDGDAIGSVLAASAALEAMGKTVERWIMPPLTTNLKKLTQGVALRFHADDSNPLPEGEPDRILILDTGSWAQLNPMRAWIEPRRERVIILDHHLHGDDAAALRWIDPSAAAACEIVADLIDALGVEMDGAMLRALYAGIATDTGWFRFSNASPRTHELAARLLRAGVDHAELYRWMEQGERPQKLALLTRALQNMTTPAGGRAAVMVLRPEDFQASGAQPEDTERFVDLPQVVDQIEVVALMVEAKTGSTVRVSFRSKPGPQAVDVNALARRFGGGGHARASGAKIPGPFEAAHEQLIAEIESAVRDAGFA